MELPAELRDPRRNDDIETTVRAIRRDVAFLASEKSHVARRGYARVLIAHLEHLVESPEFLPPRGYAPRRGACQDSLAIASAPDLATALAAADELSAMLRIRLVVATRVRFIDNH